MTHKSVLITGVAGFIGSSVAAALLDRGYSVIGIDNFSLFPPPQEASRDAEVLYKLQCQRLARLIGRGRFTYLTQDVSQKIDIGRAEVSVMLHLAGQSGVRSSTYHPEQYVQDNILGFIKAVEFAREHPEVERLLYASSSSVYGDQGTYPQKLSESTALGQSKSVYSTTKVTIENLATNFRTSVGHPPMTGLRFFSVYGPYGRPDMAPWRMADALQTGPYMEVFDQGTWLRDLTYIDDVVESVIRLIEVAGELPPVLNIGSGEIYSGREMVDCVTLAYGETRVNQFNLAYSNHKNKTDMAFTYADNQLLQSIVGPIKFTDLQTGINQFVKWFTERDV